MSARYRPSPNVTQFPQVGLVELMTLASVVVLYSPIPSLVQVASYFAIQHSNIRESGSTRATASRPQKKIRLEFA